VHQINLGIEMTFRHNTTDAIECLIGDFESYIDGKVDPDMESHECSLENAQKILNTLGIVRTLGASIEEGDPQVIANIWLQLKPEIEA
jgi:uncharacterized protein YifN (PemK superfamily)